VRHSRARLSHVGSVLCLFCDIQTCNMTHVCVLSHLYVCETRHACHVTSLSTRDTETVTQKQRESERESWFAPCQERGGNLKCQLRFLVLVFSFSCCFFLFSMLVAPVNPGNLVSAIAYRPTSMRLAPGFARCVLYYLRRCREDSMLQHRRLHCRRQKDRLHSILHPSSCRCQVIAANLKHSESMIHLSSDNILCFFMAAGTKGQCQRAPTGQMLASRCTSRPQDACVVTMRVLPRCVCCEHHCDLRGSKLQALPSHNAQQEY